MPKSFDQLLASYNQGKEQYYLQQKSTSAFVRTLRSLVVKDLHEKLEGGEKSQLYAWADRLSGLTTVIGGGKPTMKSAYTTYAKKLEELGSLQDYLAGAPKEGGPTRYKVICDYLRENQGPDAVAQFNKNLEAANSFLDLGLNMAELQMSDEIGEEDLEQEQIENNNLNINNLRQSDVSEKLSVAPGEQDNNPEQNIRPSKMSIRPSKMSLVPGEQYDEELAAWRDGIIGELNKPVVGNEVKKPTIELISGYKEQLGNAQNSPEKNVQLLTQIMAARKVINVEPDHRSDLENRKTSESVVNQTAVELMKNGHYLGFMRDLANDTKKMAKVKRDLKSGNGGALDEDFRTYLKQQPAGNLRPSETLSRYMPNVKERLEGIKSNVKKGKEPDAVKAAAEVVALRSMIRAERKEKSSLEQPIPVHTDPTLGKRITTLCKDENFKSLVENDPEVASKLKDGHGGDLVDYIRNKDRKGKEGIAGDSWKLLYANTRIGRLRELKQQAEDCRNKLSKGEKADYKDVIREYFVLNSELVDKNGAPRKDASEKLWDNISWSDMAKKQQKAPEVPLNLESNYAVKDALEKIRDASLPGDKTKLIEAEPIAQDNLEKQNEGNQLNLT